MEEFGASTGILPRTIAEAHQWLKENRNKSKKDFIAFVNYHNAHKAELALSPEETETLHNLHAMWKVASKVYDVNFYFEMKGHHAVLNGKLEKNGEWDRYMDGFLRWRSLLLATANSVGSMTF
jgi:hypothetical protein